MFQRLTTQTLRNDACQKIRALISAHAEWFCTSANDRTLLLRKKEIDLSILQQRLVLTCWTERGSQSWRILGWQMNGESLLLQASRRMGAERPLIELVPRAAASAIAATIRAARQQRCDRLAQLACSAQLDTRIERSALSPGIRKGQPGRYARILLKRKRGRLAVTGLVVSSQPSAVDAFLSSALLWFKRTAERIRPPYVEQLWLAVPRTMLQALLPRVALLRESLKQIIVVFVVDDGLSSLELINCPDRDALWKKRLARFPPVPPAQMTEETLNIVAEAPDSIDVVHALQGETLRYLGLPFARVRTLLDVTRVWFGVSGSPRRLLDDSTTHDWKNLLSDLRQYRSAEAPDHRNALYATAAEAWLESMLRRDITRLDPGLIIAPLHAQFRTARGGKLGIRPIDMLALRQDGRLVVIELKVAADREHVLQGADYWRRVEAHRRRGHIAGAKLFGDRIIRNETPLVYLVAPTLRVHPSFQTLARCIANDIEIYRFDINEDWRSGVRVMRRIRVN